MKQKRILSALLAVLILCSVLTFLPASAAETEPDISSGNALVALCVDNGQYLYSSRGGEQVAPTVVTKLVSTMVIHDLFTERGVNMDEYTVTVTSQSLENVGPIGDISAPSMGLSAGSTYTVRDLLSASLVANANDAVSVLAYYCGEAFLGGGIADFVARMNKKAQSLGLTKTKFVNATGLDSVAQTTTPDEAAKIAAAFYKYDYLVKLSDVESFLFNGKSTVRNKNYLKSNFFVAGFLNKRAIGMIAGQKNSRSDYCLITACEKEGRAYVFVVMCATGMKVDPEGNRSFGEGNAYTDINKLIDWSLSSFEYMTVASPNDIVDELHVNLGSSTDHVIVVPETTVESLINLEASSESITKTISYDKNVVYESEFGGTTVNTVDAPIAKGTRVGTVTYSFNGMELATVPLVTKDSVDSSGMLTAIDNVKGFLFGDVMMTVLKVIAALVILYVLFSIAMAIVRGVKKVRSKKDKTYPKKPTQPQKPVDKNTNTREF